MPYYALNDDGSVQATSDPSGWSGTRPVGRDHVIEGDPSSMWVSTVFLGLDHGWGFGAPQLFETMVFSNDEDFAGNGWVYRYSTLADARRGHELVLAWLRAGGSLEATDLETAIDSEVA